MSDCVEWTGYITPSGYGRIWCKKRKKGIDIHRYTWEQNKGPIPKGKVIRHLCHNKKCHNIDHLAIGTQKENIHDNFDVGSIRRNHNHGMAKLSKHEYQLIYSLKDYPRKYGDGFVKKLSKQYNITPQQIRNIWNGKNWSKE